jgi:protection of telomeres protein 1
MLSDSDSSSGGGGSDSDGDIATCVHSSQNRRWAWEWRFCLLVEDPTPTCRTQPKERMKLFVSGQDAVHLLKLDAAK